MANGCFMLVQEMGGSTNRIPTEGSAYRYAKKTPRKVGFDQKCGKKTSAIHNISIPNIHVKCQSNVKCMSILRKPYFFQEKTSTCR